ncbi:hypothetical protein FPQ18DRAFT_401189 [Pyronema domesticum]|nr:hypothetical protein FPQ18DRAFT_401189 [Pyronema domesticum]
MCSEALTLQNPGWRAEPYGPNPHQMSYYDFPLLRSQPTPSQPTPHLPPFHYGSQYPPRGYQQHPGTPQNPGWRAEWGPYGLNPHQMSYGHSPFPTTDQPGAYPSFDGPNPHQMSYGHSPFPTTDQPGAYPSFDGPNPHQMSYGHSPFPTTDQPGAYPSFVPIPGATQLPPTTDQPGEKNQVYSFVNSFVPIPNDIERMYKCGFNGCENAYSELNALNVHVAMKNHGVKRTAKEFKEIRERRYKCGWNGCEKAYGQLRHLNEHVTSKSHGAKRNKIRKNKPRRRPEDIERMYKCGFNGCENAYSELNHLNVHMVMNNHGVKLTAEDGRKIREEWKKKKKKEEEEAVKEMKCKLKSSYRLISQPTTLSPYYYRWHP